jgi:thiol-disulfide isomerase/thioredoxin
MRNLHQKVQFLANIAIIVVAILLGGVLVSRYLLPIFHKFETVEDPRIKPGTKLSLTGVDWSKSTQTLLLVLSTNCHYCTESAPFYQRLAQRKAGRQDVRVVAVLPQVVSEAQKYLGDHSVSADEVTQSAPGAVYAKATPTLILVDKTGSVLSSWVGKLPPEKEDEVLQRFLGQRNNN